MDDALVVVQIEPPVATVTLNHPPANIITPAMIEQLAAAVDRLRADGSVKAVVITGAGGSFAAGADIKVIASIRSAAEGEAMARGGQAVFDRIEQMPVPAIAAITGFCLGGGMELALACHLRVAGDRAKMGLPEIHLGIIPGFGGTQRLTRLVGRSRAMALILSGDVIGAEEAKTIGLVNRVVPEGEVLRQALGLAKKIAAYGRRSIEAAMQAMVEGEHLPLPDGLALEARLFGGLCETADMKEGLAAFIEKRQPKFQDR